MARLLGGLLLLMSALLPRGAVGQGFEVLSFRHPKQCERMQCLGSDIAFCKDHLKGFYAKEKGCTNEQICTNCSHGNTTVPTLCRCENQPFFQYVRYGDRCDAAKLCSEGICFRPCSTYLHVTQCPTPRCVWNTTSYLCQDAPPQLEAVDWQQIRYGKEPLPSTFPMSFHDFEEGAKGYRVMGYPLEDLVLLETMFIQMDDNNDGSLSMSEYENLSPMLDKLDMEALARQNQTENAARRQLQSSTELNPEVCNELGKVYCSFDATCKEDCSSCGWKSAVDPEFYMCVQPTPQSCHNDRGKEYCPADRSCHPNGDCSKCPEMPIVDYRQHVCLEPWWNKDPPKQWSNWVCRHRQKVGMQCRNDMDCIYGVRRCLKDQSGIRRCQPLQPYNENHTCAEDYDCPHIGYYCQEDHTNGEDPYFVKVCRRQQEVGDKCSANRECSAMARCNTGEKPPRCRALFSLQIGQPSVEPSLCILGWTDKHNVCAQPAKSKSVGRSCEADRDCITTDQTGKFGECQCKQWWDSGDSKFCAPVAGDYTNHQESKRNWLYFKATRCGSFWSDEACVEEWGDEGLSIYYALMCEGQQLSRGPYLPPAECNIKDTKRFVDYCSLLTSIGGAARGFGLLGGAGSLLLLLMISILAAGVLPLLLPPVRHQ